MVKELHDEEEVRELMSGKTPIVVFFYMTGCPHCDRTMGPWKEIAKRNLPYSFAQVESEHVPAEMGVSGFPHFIARHKGGAETTSDGAKESADDIMKSLNLVPSGGRRHMRRTRRKRARRATRRVRKVAH